MWKLNITLLIKEEIIREIRKYFEMNENENKHTKSYRIQQKPYWQGNLSVCPYVKNERSET